MKKIFALSLGFLFLLISWMSFSYFKEQGESFVYPDIYSKVQIEILPKHIGQTLTDIDKAAQKLGIEVTKIDYDRSVQAKRVSVYTSDLQRYKDRLKYGRLPEANGEYISSKKSGNINQVGQISVFSTDKEIRLYSLASLKSSVNVVQLQIYSMDKTLLNEFIQRVNAIDNGSKYQATLIGAEKYLGYKFIDVLEQYRLLFILMIIITTMLALYLVFRELKGETIKKTLGYSNRRLAVEFLPRVYVPASACMFVLVAVITVAALYHYNRLTLGAAFFKFYSLLSIAVIALVYIIVFIFHLTLISATQPIGIIKNKFPYKSVLGTTYIYKLIIVLLLAPMIASIISLYHQNILYGNSAKRLEILKNYVELPLYSNRMETNKGTYELGEQYKKFFALQNARGAILFDISYKLEQKANGVEGMETEDHQDSKPDEKNYAYANHITVNYEYLRQNPIYDVNGKRVLFTDESEKVVHVLIPETLKSYKDVLKKNITNNITSDYYILEDILSDKKISHPNRKIQITWIKDGQSYFTYDPNIGMINNCYIQDAISYVYNNATISGNIIAPAFSNDCVKIPLKKAQQNLAYFKDDIKACGLEDSVLVVNNCYQRVSDTVYMVEQQLNKNIAFGVAYLIVFIILIFISALTVIHAEKRKLYIMGLLGYSAFRCNLPYYIRSAVFWIAVFILMNITTGVGISVAACICIMSLIMEMVVQTIVQNYRGIQQPNSL